MHRVLTVIAVVLAGGCASATPEPDAAKPSPTLARPDAPPEPTTAPTDAATCSERLDAYRSQRDALNRCERDSDCAEIWPGLCPQGPHYIHRGSDIAVLTALHTAIEAQCEGPECEPPMELGIASCSAGKCVPGRAPPIKSADEDCWDYRERYLEARDVEHGTTVAGVQGVTPHLVVAPASGGTLRLTVEWPRACADCKLLVSEHQSGMANLVDTTPKSTEDTDRDGAPLRREVIELAVTPGPYHVIATSSAPVSYLLRSELEPATVTMHGTAWIRLCEG